MDNDSVRAFQINEGEVVKGTIKNIKPSLNKDTLKMTDVVIEGEGRTFILRVKEEMKERFKVGYILSIQKTADGLQAQINPVQKVINQIKM